LILSLVSTLPKCATTTGVPTLATIRSRFHVVKDEVRKAGLAPANAPPLLGQMIGNFLAMISVEPTKPIAGEGIEAVLSRTYGFVEDGQLDLALKEVQNIRGYPRILMADWEEMLTNRLIAEQAAEGLRAVTALKHIQFL
jgi:MICOS complex subunit MIC60